MVRRRFSVSRQVYYYVGMSLSVEHVSRILSRLRRFGHVSRRDMNSQICEVTELEITGKRKKGQPRKSWEECINKDLERYDLSREDAYDPEIW